VTARCALRAAVTTADVLLCNRGPGRAEDDSGERERHGLLPETTSVFDVHDVTLFFQTMDDCRVHDPMARESRALSQM
jgi:hypothetical protein